MARCRSIVVLIAICTIGGTWAQLVVNPTDTTKSPELTTVTTAAPETAAPTTPGSSSETPAPTSPDTSAPTTPNTQGSTSAAGQNETGCADQLANYASCVATATDAIVRETIPIIGRIENCLNLSKCFDANNETAEKPPPIQPEGSFRNVQFGTLSKCANAASEDFQNRTRQCVIDRVPDWNSESRKKQEQAANFIRQPFNYINGVKGRIPQICPNKRAQDAARTCIDMQIRRNKGPSWSEIQTGLNKLCKAKNECQNQLSQQCQNRLEKLRDAGCKCIQESIGPSSDTFFNCLNNDIINRIRKFLDGSKYFNTKASSSFCNLFDPCRLSGTNSQPQPQLPLQLRPQPSQLQPQQPQSQQQSQFKPLQFQQQPQQNVFGGIVASAKEIMQSASNGNFQPNGNITAERVKQ